MKLRHFLATLLALVILSGARLPEQTRWVNPHLFSGTALEATYTPTPIQSITTFDLTVTTPTTTNTTAGGVINVNPSYSVLMSNAVGNDATAGQTPGASLLKGALAGDGQSVTVTRNACCGGGSPTYTGTVVQFITQFVKSRGCGTITMSGAATGDSSSFTSVTTAKTLLFYTGQTSDDGGSLNITNNALIKHKFKTTPTATVITASRSSNTDVSVSGFCYVEFK